MKKHLAAGIALFVLLAGCGSDGSPKALPVLGGGDAAASTRLAAPEDMPIGGGGGPTYELDGELPELDDEARAWELPFEKADDDRVAEIAEVFGIEGDVERTEGGWSVVDGDRRLDVQRQAGLPWNLYRSEDDAVSSSVTSSEVMCIPEKPCPTPEEPERPADLPTKRQAEEQARDLLDELGVDLDDARVTVEDGFSVWNVLADPDVDGLPVIGMTTSVAIGPKGEVSYANGWMGEPEEGDRYPLIGTKAAFDKLEEGPIALMDTGAPEPLIARCDPAADCVPPDGPYEPPVIHITGVHLGLQLFSSWQLDEPAYLVPTYLFETKDEGELPVIAIDEEFLTEPPRPEPLPEPGGGSGGGSSGSSGSCSGSGSSSASPNGAAEDASIEVCGPDSGAVGEELTWEAKASCGDELEVDFGDGDVVTEPFGTISHTYAEAGAYEVRFRATECGAEIATTVAIGETVTPTQVEPAPPDQPVRQ